MLPAHNQPFPVVFDNGHAARAIRIKPHTDPVVCLRMLGFDRMRPVIFISGGASNMTEDDKALTRSIIAGIARFAEERQAVVIDGGTESGIMKMVGDTRGELNYAFSLIGVSPLGKVSFPGYKNPDEEAFLEDSHSHFVLVDGPEWGDESHMIVNLTHAMCGDGRLPRVGILINGGQIAMHDVYLATTTSSKVSIIVLEGSGRAADEIATAHRTGQTDQKVVQAILDGGDIEIVKTADGPDAMLKMLVKKFTTE